MSSTRRIARAGTNPLKQRIRSREEQISVRDQIASWQFRQAMSVVRENARIDRVHRGVKALVEPPPSLTRWQPPFVDAAVLVLFVMLAAGILVLALGGRR